MSESDTFLDAFPLAAIVVDSDERISQANVKATTLFGHGLVGRPYVTMLRQACFARVY